MRVTIHSPGLQKARRGRGSKRGRQVRCGAKLENMKVWGERAKVQPEAR
jgi:hypothetical protein